RGVAVQAQRRRLHLAVSRFRCTHGGGCECIRLRLSFFLVFVIARLVAVPRLALRRRGVERIFRLLLGGSLRQSACVLYRRRRTRVSGGGRQGLTRLLAEADFFLLAWPLNRLLFPALCLAARLRRIAVCLRRCNSLLVSE